MLRIVGAALLCIVARSTCPPEDFSSIAKFELDSFIAKPWYIQQQMPTSYLPKAQNWCVSAVYNRLPKQSLLGYDLHVHNIAEEQDGTVHDSDKNIKGGGIEAKIVDAATGKLEVAPWFVPPAVGAGPYWVIDYDEVQGYALISGGAPKVAGSNGKCRTGGGINDAGLWIFTRAQKRNDGMVSKVRDIALKIGFDLSVLNDVDQSNCTSHGTAQMGVSDIMV